MRPVRILSLLFVLLLTTPAAMAQGAAERLQTILSWVPEAALAGGQGPIVAGYGNGDAVRWIAVRGAQDGQNPETPNRFAALRSAPPSQQAIIAAASDEAIRAAIGLIPADWVDTFEVTQGNIRLGAMDIFPDSEMRLRGALYSRGFLEAVRNGAPVLWQGEADHAPDPARVDPANPFGGDIGLPTRVAFTGDRAVWATGWQTLEMVLAPFSPTLAERSDARGVIEGLRRVGNLGALASVRCWLRNGGEMPIVGAESGPVEGLALADFAIRENEGAAMVLLLAEGTDADAFAARLRDAWPVLSDLPSPAEPEITSGGGSVTVTISSDWGDDGAETNGAYEVFLNVLNGGRLGYLLNR